MLIKEIITSLISYSFLNYESKLYSIIFINFDDSIMFRLWINFLVTIQYTNIIYTAYRFFYWLCKDKIQRTPSLKGGQIENADPEIFSRWAVTQYDLDYEQLKSMQKSDTRTHVRHILNVRDFIVCFFMCNRTQFKIFLPSFRTLLWRFFIARAISRVYDFHFRHFSLYYEWVTFLLINLLINVYIFLTSPEDGEMRLYFFAD